MEAEEYRILKNGLVNIDRNFYLYLNEVIIYSLSIRLFLSGNEIRIGIFDVSGRVLYSNSYRYANDIHSKRVCDFICDLFEGYITMVLAI